MDNGSIYVMVYSKRGIVIYLIIITLIILNVSLFLNGINLSCDKCVVEFKNSQVSGVALQEPMVVSVEKAQDLYDNWANDVCLIQYDRVQGFRK